MRFDFNAGSTNVARCRRLVADRAPGCGVRVYVETNLVLELVFEQEQHASCEAILQLAKAHDIQLVLPAYSVVEASTVL